MGLFSKKKKLSIDDASMKMMLVASDAIGKLSAFNDVDDMQSMTVSMGYFFGLLQLHLNKTTSLDMTNAVINKSIKNLEEAMKNNANFENFGNQVKTNAVNSSANLQYAMKELKENPFMGLAVFYLKDLYNSTSLDINKIDIAENNIRLLNDVISKEIKDIKIVK